MGSSSSSSLRPSVYLLLSFWEAVNEGGEHGIHPLGFTQPDRLVICGQHFLQGARQLQSSQSPFSVDLALVTGRGTKRDILAELKTVSDQNVNENLGMERLSKRRWNMEEMAGLRYRLVVRGPQGLKGGTMLPLIPPCTTTQQLHSAAPVPTMLPLLLPSPYLPPHVPDPQGPATWSQLWALHHPTEAQDVNWIIL